AVSLHEFDLGMNLVAVGLDGVVDVIDEQTLARQVGVEVLALTVLDQEILGANSGVRPQPIDGVVTLDVGDLHFAVLSLVDYRDPALAALAQSGGMSGTTPPAVPATAGH